MKIKKNPVLGRWEMAESDSGASLSAKVDVNLAPFDSSAMLIIDDEVSIRQIFAKVISIAFKHIKVDTACNGKEGVERFKAKHHCVILMDLAMPVMDGFAAFQAIMEHCSAENWQVPAIVFCTGYDPPHGVRNFVSDNPLHCLLCKPVSNSVLVDALRKRIPPPPASS